MGQITDVLRATRGADRAAVMERLVPLVYDELRALARAQLRSERPDHTLQPTALVHEAYLRLGVGAEIWAERRHFFAAAAEAMRRILIEHARRRTRQKRGGGLTRVSLRDIGAVETRAPGELLALDDAFRRLEEEDPGAADVVRLRFFAGLSVDETADALGVSARTVKREWAFARAWLFRALSDRPAGLEAGQGTDSKGPKRPREA